MKNIHPFAYVLLQLFNFLFNGHEKNFVFQKPTIELVFLLTYLLNCFLYSSSKTYALL